jgi:hypothetical protein
MGIGVPAAILSRLLVIVSVMTNNPVGSATRGCILVRHFINVPFVPSF